MDNQETHRYDDIINLPHPTSKTHPRMPLYNRATQFSPFAALTGHDAAIAETARRTDEKHQLSEDTIAELNEKLNLIAETIGTKQTVTITYFVPDLKKSGGSYVTCTGVVRKIDTYNHALIDEKRDFFHSSGNALPHPEKVSFFTLYIILIPRLHLPGTLIP